MVERAYYPMRIDVSMDDDVQAMEAIDCLTSTCCVADGRYNRAFLGASKLERNYDLINS